MLTLAQHPNNLLIVIKKTVVETSSGIISDYRLDLSKGLFFNMSLIQNVTHCDLETEIQIALNGKGSLKE